MFPSLWQEEKLKRELWETMITVWVMIFLRDVPLLVAGGEAEEGAVGDHDCHLHEQRPALHQPGPHQVICFLPQLITYIVTAKGKFKAEITYV